MSRVLLANTLLIGTNVYLPEYSQLMSGIDPRVKTKDRYWLLIFATAMQA